MPRHLKSSDLRPVISTLYCVVRDATTMKDDDIINRYRLSIDSHRMTGEQVAKECDPTGAEFLLAGRDIGEGYIS